MSVTGASFWLLALSFQRLAPRIRHPDRRLALESTQTAGGRGPFGRAQAKLSLRMRGGADFLRRQPLFWSGILDSGRTAAPYPPASLSGEEPEVGAPRS